MREQYWPPLGERIALDVNRDQRVSLFLMSVWTLSCSLATQEKHGRLVSEEQRWSWPAGGHPYGSPGKEKSGERGSGSDSASTDLQQG